jgi:Domain of unknown function (DUF4926)
VVLTVPLSDHALEPSDVGVVVHIYPRHKAYEVEFVTLAGQTAAIVTASADQIRPIGFDFRDKLPPSDNTCNVQIARFCNRDQASRDLGVGYI